MSTLERFWYQPTLNWVTRSLLPLSWIFKQLVELRQFLYHSKIKKSISFPVPIIVVGNITVGGTGKTPFVIWLVNFLKEQGFKPGIVSRGMGGAKQYQPYIVNTHSNTNIVGDEAILLKARTGCPMVICIDRVAAVKKLLSHSECNVVVSDDGLQHYRLARDIEIAIVDGARGFGNQKLLPAGPLRESMGRLNDVNFVIHHSQSQLNDMTMHLVGDVLYSLKNKNQLDVAHFQNTQVHAVAAIGNPERFFSSLRRMRLNIIEHVFPDHYRYNAKDFNFSDSSPIIMTEKDAVKCQEFADDRFWYLPVTAVVSDNFKKLLLKEVIDANV